MKALSVLAAVGIAMFAASAYSGPHVVPNAPAEFQGMKNPVEFDELDEKAVKSVDRMYQGKCKKCHGDEGGGDGSAAKDMLIKPTAFNAPGYFQKKSDGQLFWILKNGSPDTEMKAFGPGTDNNLSDDEMWKLVGFIKAKFAK